MNISLSRQGTAVPMRAFAVVLSLGAAVALIVSIQASGAPPPRAANQTLVLQLAVNPPLLDPSFNENDHNLTLLENVYLTLTDVDPKGNVIPALATSWKAKGRVWTFSIRQGARFSDGTPITARDVKYSLVRDLTPIATAEMRKLGVSSASPHGFTVLFDVLGASAVANGAAKSLPANAITAPTQYTVKVVLVRPSPNLPLRLANHTLGIVKAANVAKSSASRPWWYKPVGSGPFKVASFVPNTSVDLVPNPYYYGAKPILKRVKFKVVTNSQTAQIAYEAKSLHLVRVPYSDVAGLRSHGFASQLRSAPEANVTGILVNNKVPPADDLLVVRALAMATDKATLTKKVLGGLVEPATTFTPHFFPDYNAAGFKPVKFNPAGAKALLARSKYGSGSDITVRVWPAPDEDARTMPALKQMWEQNLGIKVQIDTNFPSPTAPLSQGMSGLLLAQGSNYIAPCSMVQRWQDFLIFASGANQPNAFGAISGPRMSSLLASCHGANSSTVAKRVIAVEQLMTEYPWFIPMIYNRSYILVQPFVKGLLYGHDRDIINLSQVWIARH